MPNKRHKIFFICVCISFIPCSVNNRIKRIYIYRSRKNHENTASMSKKNIVKAFQLLSIIAIYVCCSIERENWRGDRWRCEANDGEIIGFDIGVFDRSAD